MVFSGLLVDFLPRNLHSPDLVFWITDENTGGVHHYNPKLNEIFSTVHKSVKVDSSVLEGLEDE